MNDLLKFFQPKTAAEKVGLFALLMFSATAAMAIVAPAVGSLGYDLYDIFVLQGIQGAPGFVAGVIGIAYSATLMNGGNWKMPAIGVLGSSALIRADDITTSLGMII